jgi:hypothetical protein
MFDNLTSQETLLLDKAYEQYKEDWCEIRGYSLEDVDEESGFYGGDCYVSKDEFFNNEFNDEDIMREILNKEDFDMWLKLFA